MAGWFVMRNGDVSGPKSADELLAMARDGRLLPADQVRADGQGDWLPAGRSSRLFPKKSSSFVVEDAPAANPGLLVVTAIVALVAAGGLTWLFVSRAPHERASNAAGAPIPQALADSRTPVQISIQRVLDADRSAEVLLGKALRSNGRRSSSGAAQSVGDFCELLRSADLAGCPSDFASAQVKYIAAWKAVGNAIADLPENGFAEFGEGFLAGYISTYFDVPFDPRELDRTPAFRQACQAMGAAANDVVRIAAAYGVTLPDVSPTEQSNIASVQNSSAAVQNVVLVLTADVRFLRAGRIVFVGGFQKRGRWHTGSLTGTRYWSWKEIEGRPGEVIRASGFLPHASTKCRGSRSGLQRDRSDRRRGLTGSEGAGPTTSRTPSPVVAWSLERPARITEVLSLTSPRNSPVYLTLVAVCFTTISAALTTGALIAGWISPDTWVGGSLIVGLLGAGWMIVGRRPVCQGLQPQSAIVAGPIKSDATADVMDPIAPAEKSAAWAAAGLPVLCDLGAGDDADQIRCPRRHHRPDHSGRGSRCPGGSRVAGGVGDHEAGDDSVQFRCRVASRKSGAGRRVSRVDEPAWSSRGGGHELNTDAAAGEQERGREDSARSSRRTVRTGASGRSRSLKRDSSRRSKPLDLK